MDSARMQKLCEIPQANKSLVDEAWSFCKEHVPAGGALAFGTVDGVMSNGMDRIVKNPGAAQMEGVGAVCMGIALKAAPKWISIPAGIIGGAATASYLRDSFGCAGRVAPLLNNASFDPECARKQIAREVGPIAFEGLSMVALAGLSAQGTSRFNSRKILPVVDLRRPSLVTRVVGNPLIPKDELMAYKVPIRGTKLSLPDLTAELKRHPGYASSLKLQRTFSQAKEFKVYKEDLTLSDEVKHRLIKHFKPEDAAKMSSEKYLAIPTQTREFSGVTCLLRPRNHPIAQLYEKAKQSVVKVVASDSEYSSSGSGFVVSQDGKVATALHLIEGADKLAVRLNDGTKYSAHLVGHDFESDLAILQIAGRTRQFKPLELSSKKPGDHEIYLLGHPAGSDTLFMSPGLYHRQGFEKAVIAGKDNSAHLFEGRPYETSSYFVHCRNGNSGGPVLNSQGKVIAVHTDNDVHAKGLYDEVRVGVGASSNELAKLLRTIPANPPSDEIWKLSTMIDRAR